LSSAAVFSVYAAGYLRTRDAAERFTRESNERRRPITPAVVAALAPKVDTPIAAQAQTVSELGVAKPSKPAPKKVARDTVSGHADSLAASRPLAAEIQTPSTPAPAPTPAPAADTAAAQPEKQEKPRALKDGLYLGWGTSRHGDIEAAVEIKEGKIASAFISQCLTRYSCSWIAPLPPQVVKRQSPEVDFVSGATESTNAFYYAVVEALKKAK
jgi:uncharacterized protein with FMN-binding domain